MQKTATPLPLWYRGMADKIVHLRAQRHRDAQLPEPTRTAPGTGPGNGLPVGFHVGASCMRSSSV